MSSANLINADFEKGRHLFEGLSQPKVSLKLCSIEQDMTLSLFLFCRITNIKRLHLKLEA